MRAVVIACLGLGCAREPAQARPVHVQAPALPAAGREAAVVAVPAATVSGTPGSGATVSGTQESDATVSGTPGSAATMSGTPGSDATVSGAPGSGTPASAALPVAPDGTRALPCRAPPAGLACVPGGPFVRGSDDGPEDTRPRATVWLQTFYMATHEVTYAQYKACEAAGACAPAGPRYNDYDRPRQPIVGVSWHDAVAYCAAQGLHLPSEAQWEKAARGPDGALYPWGDERATCARAVIKEKRRRSCGVAKLGERPDKGRTFEVGQRPPGVYGLYDMAGNAWEWVADWYSEDYRRCGAACAGVDPRGPCDGATPCKRHHERVVRGGSWYWEAEYATAIYRRAHVPSNRPYHHYGFRCAASDAELAALTGGGAGG